MHQLAKLEIEAATSPYNTHTHTHTPHTHTHWIEAGIHVRNLLRVCCDVIHQQLWESGSGYETTIDRLLTEYKEVSNRGYIQASTFIYS